MAKRPKKRDPNKLTPKEVRQRHQHRKEQRKLFLGAGAVVLSIVLILLFGFYRENIAIARAPVAIVNGKKISTHAYQQMVKYQRFNLIANLGLQANQQALVSFLQDQLPQAVLDNMIDQVFVEQKAAEDGISVTDDDVQAEIEKQFGFAGDVPTPTPSTSDTVTDTTAADVVTREDFEAAYKNFLDALKAQTDISESEYRNILREQLIQQKVREALGATVATTAAQVHARHILVETEEEARQVIDRLQAGEDFAALATELSKDTASAEKGGDLGWFGRGKMVPEFEEVAFSQPIGEIGEPVKSQFGYHIIEVLERDDNRELTPAELEQARRKSYTDWLQSQRAAADIERRWTPDVVPDLPPALSAAQAPPPPPSQ